MRQARGRSHRDGSAEQATARVLRVADAAARRPALGDTSIVAFFAAREERTGTALGGGRCARPAMRMR